MNDIALHPIMHYHKVSGSDLGSYWFDAYGWIACYFAQLEGVSYALIELLGTQSDRTRMKRLRYQERTELAKSLVCTYFRERGDKALEDEWEAVLTQARSAAPMRNTVLHNPLSVNLALGDPLHDPDAGILAVGEPGRTVLKLGAVQAFAQSMHGLATQLHDLLLRSGFPRPASPPAVDP